MKSAVLFLFIFIVLCSSACKREQTPNAQNIKKPNVILIMADDLGYETLGTYGSDSYLTPNLDLLAKEGMQFNQCYSTPLCTPSRVQIMTGQYNFRNYIGFGLLDATEKTFGHYMQQAGYKTFVAGKWQLLGNERQQQLAGGKIGSTPEQAGFDEFCLWQIDQRGTRYKDPLLSINEKGAVKFPNRYGPDVFVEYIESFMEKNQNEPMFIYYPMVLTHDPFVPTPDNPEFKDFKAESKINDPAYFAEMVNYMDYLVGRIVKKTEALIIRQNTLILFVGDNGTDTDITSIINGVPLVGDKGNTTNAGTHVPLIASWKGTVEEGSINDNLIDFTDFLPTILEATTGSPSDTLQTDGHSFYPQLLGKDTKVRDWIFCDYAPNWGKFKARRYVQNTNWKLYGNGKFYNLKDDPLEENPMEITEQSNELFPLVQQFEKVLEKYKTTNQ